ncbi:MAG: type IV pilus modification protein PilV [Burkholderiales bacterium]
MKAKQKGVMLLEAMIALLIFAMGVLAVIGMQAKSIGQTMDARYRVDAAFLANQILAQMWADRANLASYACNPCTSGSIYPPLQAWVKQIQNTTSQSAYLPGVTDSANQPVIVINSGNQVTVTLNWKSPQGGGIHNYTTMAQING